MTPPHESQRIFGRVSPSLFCSNINAIGFRLLDSGASAIAASIVVVHAVTGARRAGVETHALPRIHFAPKPFWRITIPQPDGSRKFKTYADQAEARAAFELMEIEHQNHGTAMLTISDELRS